MRLGRAWLRRFNWNPFVVAVPLAFFCWRVATVGFNPVRTVGLCVVCVWFALAVADRMTRGRVLRWIYDTADGVDPAARVGE